MGELSRNIKLGIFVFAGTLFFIVLLYIIGSKQNMFNKTISVTARFYNADGLMGGNAVRFAGINIGTVKSVAIINDSTVEVLMILQKNVIEHVKKNATASIGTDGLMGNKLVNISTTPGASETVEEGDVLTTYKAVSANDMLKTLSVTNENVKEITEELKDIATKLNNSNSLWNYCYLIL